MSSLRLHPRSRRRALRSPPPTLAGDYDPAAQKTDRLQFSVSTLPPVRPSV